MVTKKNRKVRALVNKTSVRKAVNNWLKKVKLGKGEDFSVYEDENQIKITVCDERGHYREDKNARPFPTPKIGGRK